MLFRSPALEKLMFSFLHGLEPDEFGRIQRRIYEDLNNTKFADAAVKMYNLIHAVEMKKAGVINPKLQIAALFINREGEDLGTWSDEMLKSKLEAWKNHSAGFFFQLADERITGILRQVYGVAEELSEMMNELGNKIHRTDIHAMKKVQDLTTKFTNK